MRIPDSKIAEVAAAVNIVEVISDYVELKRAGKDFRGLCPFHGDKDPSFYVSPQKEIFHCFGCHTGGSVFSFLMKMENVSFAEAVRKLAGRYGVPFEYERIRKSSDDPKGVVDGAGGKTLVCHPGGMLFDIPGGKLPGHLPTRKQEAPE